MGDAQRGPLLFVFCQALFPSGDQPEGKQGLFFSRWQRESLNHVKRLGKKITLKYVTTICCSCQQQILTSMYNHFRIHMENETSQTFYVEFGRRIARFRKEANLTQAQLAEKLGLKQQLIAAYEKGIRRIPLSHLKPLAQALSVDIEDFLGIERKKGKRGPAPVLLKKLEDIQKLPASKQKFVLDFLDTVTHGS
jgi:transcriptional regulator with XRE-family HTH domain